MSTITYRKTGKGEWVAFGPASVIRAGATVTVTKRGGETKTEHITSVGKPFTADGQQMVYGYLAASAAPSPRSDSRRQPTALQMARAGSYYRPRRTRTCPTGGNCSSFGNGHSCGAPDCDGY